MKTQCPFCGRPLSALEQLLAAQDTNYQCRHCWNRIHATGAVTPPFEAERRSKPRVLSIRRAARVHGRKS